MTQARSKVFPRLAASLSWLAIVGLVGALFSLATVPSVPSSALDGLTPLEPGFHAPTGSMLFISPVPSPTSTTNPTRGAWVLPILLLGLALPRGQHPGQSQAHQGAGKAQRWFARRLLDGG